MSDELDVRRGEEARLLLENPILAEAFSAIESDLMRQWQESPARDVEGREKLWLTLKLLGRVKGQLESVVETGKVAQATLAERAMEAARRAGRAITNP